MAIDFEIPAEAKAVRERVRKEMAAAYSKWLRETAAK